MIPARYQNAEYDEVPDKIRELFQRIPETRRGIYIHGDVGTGKTHISYALKKKWDVPASKDSRGRHSLFWNVTELLRELRADFDRREGRKEHLDEYLMGYEGLLFLDDLGAEKVTDWVQETLYLIINSRYDHMLPTVITSNHPIKDLLDKVGDRTVSRIVDMCDIVELIGKDRRVEDATRITITL